MAGNNSFMTSLLALLDDDQFMKDVVNKPYPSTEQVEVTDYLSRVKEMLNLEGDQGQSKSSTLLSEERFVPLSSTINKLCSQITCEALYTNNARETIESLFEKLSSFSWGAKAVLTLSAFSVYYAENGHLAHIKESDHKLRLAAMLRGRRAYKLDFGALENLIRVTLEFTKSTVEFADSSKGLGALPTSIDIRASFYQIIVGVIGCSIAFIGMISTSDAFLGQDLSTFLGRVTTKYESFKKQVDNLREEHEEKRLYKEIKELYGSCTDIAKFMALLFCTKKDSLTVYHCSKKTTAKVEELQNKDVVLLISDLTLSKEDLMTLTSIYNDSFRSSNYEIMWVPIADVIDHIKFQHKRSSMPWYSCNSIVSKAAAKFIKKCWQFKQQTKVVVLNQKGELVNMDAMMMIRLWGLEALPFTQQRGCKLWEGHGDNWLKLVLNDTVFQYVEQSWERKEVIFLYGSAEDSETIKQIDVILKTKTYEPYKFKIFNINTVGNQFLSRLESCISWKMQVNKEKPDLLTQKLLELYGRCKNQSGFFVIVERGSSVIVNASLTDLWKTLSEHEQWIKKGTNTQDFDTHFQEYFTKVVPRPLCYQISIPNMVGNMPEYIKCPSTNCPLNMETVVTFKCCHAKH